MTRSIAFEQYVDVDFDAAAEALRSQPGDMVLDDVEGGTLDLHTTGDDEDGRRVVVTLDRLQEVDAHAVEVPIRWAAVERPERFPTFEGAIELSALSEHPPQSQLALIGDVQPPSSLLGKVTTVTGSDDLDAALDALLDRIGDRLVTASGGPATG